MSIVVERAVELGAPRSSVWRVLSDTERLNRAVGLGPLRVSPSASTSAARFVIRTVSGGFPLEYEEFPFEWELERRFSVRRVMRGGLIREIVNDFSLVDGPNGGTRVTVRVTCTPRYAAVAPVARAQMKRFVQRIASELGRADSELTRDPRTCLPSGTSPSDEIALERAARQLDALVVEERRPLARALVSWLREAPDADVTRIRPFELAELLGAPDLEMLATCLLAVKAGVLELSWDLVCPSCRTASDQTPTLGDLPATGHCQLCDLSFELSLDRAVEATFRPAVALRSVTSGPFCIGGPSRTPHVISQSLLPASGEAVLTAPPEPGRYRLFARGGVTTSVEAVSGADAELTLELDQARHTASVSVAPGGVLRVRQQGGVDRHVKLERLEWASRAATAHVVALLPEFRREFSGDLLRPGVSLKVARVALLFSDLTDSTALYSRIGDASAFRIVHDHFDLLFAVVERHRGAVVKTIGDAVMAAFMEERDALSAALEMHRLFPDFRRRLVDAARTFLKVGVYSGPCYVVTANGILDYFGQSVNIAARLQGAAAAGETVITAALAEEALERGWLAQGAQFRRFEAVLKGLDGAVAAARIACDEP